MFRYRVTYSSVPNRREGGCGITVPLCMFLTKPNTADNKKKGKKGKAKKNAAKKTQTSEKGKGGDAGSGQ